MSATVFIVDDDEAMRDALAHLLDASGYPVRVFDSASSFLAAVDLDTPGCLLLDVAMPGMTGLDLHRHMIEQGCHLPVVFLSGHGDIPMAVQVIQAGAIDFLEKPVNGQVLLKRVKDALAFDACRRAEQADRNDSLARYQHLTEREREVMALVVAGLSSKEIARELGISHRTVEIHRAHVMAKCGCDNLPDLVKFAAVCVQ